MSELDLSSVHDAVQQHIGADLIPGAVALVAVGDQVQVEALGSLSIDGPPIRRDSIFRIASTTKPVTAVATLALVSEGLLGLDEPVDRLLPELADRRVLRRMDGPLDDTVPAERAITPRDLLTYTFGFGQVFDMFLAAEPWPVVAAAEALRLHTFGPPEPDSTPGPDEWIAGLGSLPLVAQPGERWLYNTSGSVLGVLLARAAGQTFGEVLRTRVLDPLGMRDTAFFASDRSRLTTAYRSGPGGNLEPYDGSTGAWSRPPAFEDGSGGLVSTVDDLLALARMLLRGGDPVLPADLAAAMCTDQLTDAQKVGAVGSIYLDDRSWGFGQAVSPTGAFGWDGGLGTTWLVDPNHDLTVIVLTQRAFDSPELPSIHADVQAAAYGSLS